MSANNTVYTKAQVRAAILRAADRVEREPSCYRFNGTTVPPGCGTPSCMLGWIGFELGIPAGELVHRLAEFLHTGNMPHTWDLSYACNLYNSCEFGYVHNPAIAAAGMRAYADRYFPADAPEVVSAPNDIYPLPAFHRFLESVRRGETVDEVEEVAS